MEKICKRGCVYVLVAVITFSTVCMSYNRASTVKAFVGVDDVTIMLVLAFLAAGGCAISYSWANDGNNALDLADDYQEYYEKERLRLIEGGGGDDFDPNNLPEWDKLLISASATGAVKLSEQMFTLAQQYADSELYSYLYGLGYKLNEGGDSVADASLDIQMPLIGIPYVSRGYSTFGCSNTEYLQEYNYYLESGRIIGSSYKKTSSDQIAGLGALKEGYDSILISYTREIVPGERMTIGLYNSVTGESTFPRGGNAKFSTNVMFNRVQDSSAVMNLFGIDGVQRVVLTPSIPIYLKEIYSGKITPYTKENIWVHPDIENDYKNDGKFDVYPPYNPLQLPTEKLLQALQQAMDDADNLPDKDARDKAKEDALRDYFNDIGVNNDPTQDPATDPDKPIEPDPNPDPDNPVNPDNPDNPDNPSGDTDTKPFLADLKDLFPFCIPFDLIHAIKILNAKGEPPRWVIPINYPSVGLNEELVIDFSDAENVVVVIRVFETLGFIVALICATRALIKG